VSRRLARFGQVSNNCHSTVPAWRLLLVDCGHLVCGPFSNLLGRIVFGSDVAHWMFPARWLVRDSLFARELPGWNPFQGIGFAIFANPLLRRFLSAQLARPGRASGLGGQPADLAGFCSPGVGWSGDVFSGTTTGWIAGRGLRGSLGLVPRGL